MRTSTSLFGSFTDTIISFTNSSVQNPYLKNLYMSREQHKEFFKLIAPERTDFYNSISIKDKFKISSSLVGSTVTGAWIGAKIGSLVGLPLAGAIAGGGAGCLIGAIPVNRWSFDLYKQYSKKQ